MNNVAETLFPIGDYTLQIEEAHALSQTCNSGLIAETMFVSRAVLNGWTVWMPFGHAQKADIICWRAPARPITVQVKKATYQKDGGDFKVMVGAGKPSCAANPNNYGKRYTPYKKGDFDVLAAYIEERSEFVFWLLDEIAGKSSVRYSPCGRKTANDWGLLDRACGQ